MGEFSRNGQAQPSATVMTVDGTVLLLKGLENILELGWFNADARIDDGKGNGMFIRALDFSFIGPAYLQRHRSLLCKFEGVREQIL
ncbi:MAG TPA: hypothetical protein VFI14_03590, partial [Chryseosolibacter sp.]|nr:hypothetical protein [Chryseosolibacter sp.]